MNRQPGSHRQRGIAALTAILVVAIATVLAVNLLWTTSVDIQRTQTLLLQDQARLYDLGGEELARFFLADDGREDGQGGIDSMGEAWAKVLVRQFNEGTLEGWLVDQQGLFDLNSLVDRGTTRVNPEARAQFVRLLMLLDLDPDPRLDEVTATGLADAAVDWIDPDTQAEASGAEDDYYSGLRPPYLAANFWLTSVSELQAVRGFTPEILARLAPHVTALPRKGEGSGQWPLNVNTATDLVLASLVSNQTADSIKSVCEFAAQPQTGTEVVAEEFESAEKFRDAFRLATSAEIPVEVPLATGSNWFLLTVTTSIGTTRSTMYSLLERNGDVVQPRLRTFDAN
ncbi:MAG: type II secretion system minor pseudopilin GspK [Chromatiales bacterium]|nr:type II secretion system minor pseudopilin GspK [Chromatiales bacterium]